MMRTIAVVAMLVSAAGMGYAQEKLPGKAALTFDVASVRRDTAGASKGAATTEDGFRMTNMPMLLPILKAYIPTTGGEAAYFVNDRVLGGPDWMRLDGNDIEAKVAEAELVEWHRPATQSAMLREMLGALLAERCKLVVHREMKEVPIYALVVGKSGVKLAGAKPVVPHPLGIPMPGDAVIVPFNGDHPMSFYNATIVTLAQFLSNFAGRPVQDRTGLTGRYDFTLDGTAFAPPPPPDPQGTPVVDTRAALVTVIGLLGLRLEPAKGSIETLVIDHLERPSEN